MKVFFIESMDFFGEIRPSQCPRKFQFQLLLIAFGSFFGQFDFPSAEIVKQSHVWLDKDRQPT